MSSAFDTDNVTVSLSRLALAKAIKTPDETDSGAEPWTKSVIFHQSHVSDSMRHSMLFPNGQRQQRGHQARPQSQMMRNDQQPHQQRPPSRHLDQHQQPQYPQQRRRSRSSNHILDQYNQHPNPQQQQQQQYHHPQQHQQQQPMRRPPSGYEMYASSPQPSSHSSSHHSSSQGSHHRPSSQERSTPSSGRRKVMASDNEDSDEEDDKASSDSSDDESQITPVPQKTASYQMLNKARATPVTLTQQPSSDDDDDDESATQHKEKAVGNIHDEDHESDEDNEDRIISQNFAEMAAMRRPSGDLLDNDVLNARRMSTLRQLERGPSMHKRSRSHGDLDEMAQEAESSAAVQNPYAETAGKSGAIERWRETIGDGTPTSSRPSSVQSHQDDEPVQSRSSIAPSGYQRSRRSTVGEMDMMTYHMQQQQQMQWQMQQAAQMQQMAQIQQYQQYQSLQQQQAAMMMQQQQHQQQQHATKTPANLNPNRKSVSAMDLLAQLEKEKEESRHKKYNPKTRVSASANTTIDSGLLGRLPAKNSHNLSFQQVEQQGGLDRNKFLMRASRSDMNLSSMGSSNHQQRQRSRSPGPEKALRSSSALDLSNMGKSRSRVSNTDARRRSEMMRSESTPNVTPSMSTPINRQSMMPAAGNPMYGQYLVPMGQGMPMQMMGGAPPMMSSMSSGNRSGKNSSRRSTANWSNNNSGFR